MKKKKITNLLAVKQLLQYCSMHYNCHIQPQPILYVNQLQQEICMSLTMGNYIPVLILLSEVRLLASWKVPDVICLRSSVLGIVTVNKALLWLMRQYFYLRKYSYTIALLNLAFQSGFLSV